jgi:acetyl-CoA synthetase
MGRGEAPAMRSPILRKTAADLRVVPNLRDWEAARATFCWDDARAELFGSVDSAFNLGAAVDRHSGGPLAGKPALRWPDGTGGSLTISYAELARLTHRFANVLRDLGVARGDRVFVLTGRIPALHVSVLGALRHGCVASPLFPAFGPEPIATRLRIGAGRVLVTTETLYRRKVEKLRETLPDLAHVLLVADAPASSVPGTLDLGRLMDAAADDSDPPQTVEDDPALLHFTSGTTGVPKGVVHVHGAGLIHYVSARYALDLHPDDVFWCTADPGWVTGTSYGIVAPLLHGVTSVVDPADFEAERWYRILAEQEVSVWYTAPTAIRMLMKAGPDLARRYRFPALRFIASVGEPLNPEAVWWGREVLGLPIHDNWWQTETGGIMIANTAAMDIKPGSMGKPLPGIDASVVRRQPDGSVALISDPDVEGELALRRGWPSMFRAYLRQEERYRKCFAGDLYLTGDLVRRDADGYFWFVGRADDVIKSAGHLIGPFEVESALMEHAAVAEAAVIGKPDPIVGELVKAFVCLRAGYAASEALRSALLAHARVRLGAAVAPKEIAFAATLPHTRSGKIMRRLLKAREMGLPEGDTSTLEANP